VGKLDPASVEKWAAALPVKPRTDPEADWGEVMEQGCRHLSEFQDSSVEVYQSEGELAHPRGYAYGALFYLPASSSFCVEVGYAYG